MKRLLLVMAVLIGASSAIGADVTITFKDSTMIEDTWIKSNSSLANFGRPISGSTDRVIIYVGPNYNSQSALFRVLGFKDSIDAHAGMIIDSGKLTLHVLDAAYVGANETLFVRAIGLDTNRNWVEGNRNGAAAQDCEVCWDSCQTIGAGACATAMDWTTDGAIGTGDTLGDYMGKPSDSTRLANGGAAWGSSWDFYLDTVSMNLWKDYSYANEGFLLMSTTNTGAQCYGVFYASETRLTGRLDSIPVFTVYGHTGGGAPSTSRRRLILDK